MGEERRNQLITADTTTIVIGTFGEEDWRRLAVTRAIPSAQAEGCRVVHVHADTLHEARNGAVAQVTTPWVVHLDADDELEPGYLDGMNSRGFGDVRAPMVRYVNRGHTTSTPAFPRVYGHSHECTGECLQSGNWIVVGAAVRTHLVREVGGWRDFVWSEDWDLWLRCHLAGAKIVATRSAIYRAHVRPHSRNRGVSHAVKMATHRAIEAANGIGPGGVLL